MTLELSFKAVAALTNVCFTTDRDKKMLLQDCKMIVVFKQFNGNHRLLRSSLNWVEKVNQNNTQNDIKFQQDIKTLNHF